MRNAKWMQQGPSQSSFFLFVLVVIATYFPFRTWGVPLLRELWFRQVDCRIVQDAARLKAPSQGIWLGATRPELPQSLYGMDELQTQFDQRLTLISFYQAWGDGEEHQFPQEALRNMRKAGYIPMITWEPWLSAFSRFTGKEPQGSLQRIAQGELDPYIREWAQAAVHFRTPLLLRVAHEPSNPLYPWGPPYGNSPESFRAAWHHIHEIFQREGAKNVLFVWTPFGLLDKDYFPGKTEVDWIGFDLFNEGSLSSRGSWIDFYSLAKLHIDQYRSLGVSMLAAEVGTSSAGGNKRDWIRDMFRSVRNHELTELKGIILFDIPTGTTATGLPIDWSISEISDLHSLIQQEGFDSLFTTKHNAQQWRTSL